jgi:hypothetical protein
MLDTAISSTPTPIAYLCESLPDPGSVRLAAAVVWRGVPSPAALMGGGGLLGWLRSARHRLWLRFGPLGFDVSVAGRPLFGGDWGVASRVGCVGLPPRGEPLAYYDDNSRTLRVLGRVITAPTDGRTIVALVDASGSRAAAPRLTLRNVPTPSITVPTLVPLSPADVAASHSYILSEHPAWTAALRADPTVRDFLEVPPGS